MDQSSLYIINVIIEELRTVFAKFGLTETIVTDNGLDLRVRVSRIPEEQRCSAYNFSTIPSKTGQESCSDSRKRPEENC